MASIRKFWSGRVLVTALCLLLAVSLIPAQDEFAYSLDEEVEAGGFTVRKAFNDKTSRWHVEILQGERLLFRSGNGAKAKDDLLLGSFDLLGDGEKQLLIEEYTGDAFCCTYNYVLRVGQGLDVLYSSSQFPVGYGLSPEDLDGDGIHELVTTLTRFENFYNMPHEESPTVPVVFRYDPESRRYIVGNRAFPETILANVEDDKARVNKLNAERKRTGQTPHRWRTHFTGAVLNVALAYFYAGQQEEAWAYLVGTYDLEDRDTVLTNLRYYLLRCPIFRGVYPDTREVFRTSMRINP
jgi:hypothetical protein